MRVYGREQSIFSLCRGEEEDLVDYDDSDVEIEHGTHNKISAPQTAGNPQLDIFYNDSPNSEESNRKEMPTEDESSKTLDTVNANLVRTTRPATKTPQAATLIKAVSDLLSNAEFRASLGLASSGTTADLDFWADGLDFTLTLKLIDVAQTKACKYGAGCHNAQCTFDHGGADRTVMTATGKPAKLCSMINTPNGCSKGVACWFSHEALGLVCSRGDQRTTCPKGLYCFYKHSDDGPEASIDATATSAQVEQDIGKEVALEDPLANKALPQSEEAENIEHTARSSAFQEEPNVGTELVLCEIDHTKEHDAERKRSHPAEEVIEPIEDRPHKSQRIHRRQNTRNQCSARREPGNEHTYPVRPSNSRRAMDSYQGPGRGRGRTGGKSDRYRGLSRMQRSGGDRGGDLPLSRRILRG